MIDDDVLLDAPWTRATVRCGTVTLNAWRPALIGGGPAAMALERLARRGVALADLFCEGEPGAEELLVRFVARTRSAAAEETLLEWAQLVGYRRVWLPGRVAELEPAATLGVAEVTCPTCRSVWRDDGAGFWERVRSMGAFPGFCQACGGSLPQWRLAATGERVRDAARRDTVPR